MKKIVIRETSWKKKKNMYRINNLLINDYIKETKDILSEENMNG